MLTVCCWMWNTGFREFLPEHVNTLQRMVAKNLNVPHRFVCVTDETDGFSKDVVVFPIPPAATKLGELKTPEGKRFPSCYRRLWIFSEEAKAIGDRVLLIDIDLIVMDDILPIFSIDAEFVGWRPYRDWGAKCRFGGGIYLLKTGTRTEVWNGFKGSESVQKARAAGFRGSDQAWISYCLAGKEVYWGKDAGIYSIRDFRGDENNPPKDARLIQFNGLIKPWQSKLKWVRDRWHG